MIGVTQEFRQALLDDKRDWIEKATITLADGTVLNITNANIWGGGFSIEDAVSDDNAFGALGGVVINKATLVLNNIYDTYSEYDFTYATVKMRVGLQLSQETEMLDKGIFVAESAQYNGSLITLECYDYMARFDKPYSESTLQYPATLDTIVRDACAKCDVPLGSLDFPHKNYVVTTRPVDEAVTFREVIMWAAQIAGCFARISRYGKLEFAWFASGNSGHVEQRLDGGTFDDGSPTYTSGDTADGGSFNPWNTGYEFDSGTFADIASIHRINSTYASDIATDDTVITGVRILVTVKDGNNSDTVIDYMSGVEGFVIGIENNEFITVDTAQDIADWLYVQLGGVRFRKATIQHSSDPSIEAGDIALLTDRKGNEYNMLVTRTIFSAGEAQTTVSASETVARNSATQYTEATKNYVALRKQVVKERTAREIAQEELAAAIAAKNGLYTTEEEGSGGGTTFYLHNHPNLSDSNIVWRMTADAFAVTNDYQGDETIWNAGLTVDGNLIANILSVYGINADWINAGQLNISDTSGNETFFVDTETGVVRIAASQFSLTGKTIPEIAQDSVTSGDTNLFVTSTQTPGYLNANGLSIHGQGADKEVTSAWIAVDSDDMYSIQSWMPSNAGKTSQMWIAYAFYASNDMSTVIGSRKAKYSTAGGTYLAYTQVTPPSTATYMRVSYRTLGASDAKIKVQRGSIVGDWSPAPEDVLAYSDEQLDTFAQEVHDSISDLQRQIDGVVDTYYYDYEPTVNNYPAHDWVVAGTEAEHEGDLFLDTSTGKSYRWLMENNVWKWKEIPDTAAAQALQVAQHAQDTADGKRRVFVAQPTTAQAYDAGDLWVNATYGSTYSNDVLRCKTPKAEGAAFNINHWQLASKYTDDSSLDAFIAGDYADDIDAIGKQLDLRAQTYYQTSDPSTSWDTAAKAEHKGDLWYNSTSTVQKYYRWSGTAWQELTATPPSAVVTTINNKGQIFTSEPVPPYAKGDLWFGGATSDVLTCIKSRSSGSYVASDWKKLNKYTDDTAANQAQWTASSALENANTARNIAEAHYGTSGTPGTVADKKVDCEGFSLYTGAQIIVKFTKANTANDNLRLNVNKTGLHYVLGGTGGFVTAKTVLYNWNTANQTRTFIYDGEYWRMTSDLSVYDKYLGKEVTFNKLTDRGTQQAIKMDENGDLYINASFIRTGILKLGGKTSTIGNGSLEIYNSSDVRIGRWYNGGLYMYDVDGNSIGYWTPTGLNILKGSINLGSGKFSVNNLGSVTAKSFTANEYIYIKGNSLSDLYIPTKTTSDYYFRLNKDGILINSAYSSGTKYTYKTNIATESNVWSIDYGQSIFYSQSRHENSSSILGTRGFQAESSDGHVIVGTYRFAARNNSNNGLYISTLDTSSTNSCYCVFDGDMVVRGSLSASKTKPRLVTTKDYGERYLYCYETPSPLFGDVGEGKIGEDGKCYIQIDSIFAETVSLNQYQVFLQKYGNGDCWVSERKSSYFVVEGTVGLMFGWEIKAKQSDFDQYRLEKEIGGAMGHNENAERINYIDNLQEHINEIKSQREVNPQ